MKKYVYIIVAVLATCFYQELSFAAPLNNYLVTPQLRYTNSKIEVVAAIGNVSSVNGEYHYGSQSGASIAMYNVDKDSQTPAVEFYNFQNKESKIDLTIYDTNINKPAIRNSNGSALQFSKNYGTSNIKLSGIVSGSSDASQNSGAINFINNRIVYLTNSSRGAIYDDNQNGGNAIHIDNSDLYNNTNIDESEITIANIGTIKTENHINSTAIKAIDSENKLRFNLYNYGSIDAGSKGTAIFVGGSNLATMINSGGQITGKINLGSNENSSLQVTSDATILGNIIFGNSGQLLTLDTGSILTGDILGKGQVQIGSESSLKLIQSGSSLIESTIDGTSSSAGDVIINPSQSVVFGASIGSKYALNNFDISSGSEATLLDGVFLSATNINLLGSLNLQGATGNNINGIINGSGAGALVLNSASHFVNGGINLVSGDTISTTIINPTAAGNITATDPSIIAEGVKLKVFLPNGESSVGSEYRIFSGGSESSIYQIANENINIDGSGSKSNRVGILEFSTLVLGDDLFLKVDRLPDDIVDGIAKESGQLDFTTNVINGSNNSLNISSSRLGGLRGVSSGEAVQNKNLWGQTFASNIKQGDTGGADGYDANAVGFILGADHQFENDITAGLSFSYSNSDIKSKNSLKKIAVDSYQVNFYGSYDYDKYFINALAGIAFNEYSSNRFVSDNNSIANAQYSGNTYIARIEGGSNYKLINNFILTPKLGITAAKNEVDNYSETGAGLFGLNVKNDSTNFLEARIGAELGKNFSLSRERKIHPRVFTSYGYDFVGDKQKATTNFIGQSASFESSGGNVARESLRMGTGIGFLSSDSLMFYLDYLFETRNNYQANSLVLKAKYSF